MREYIDGAAFTQMLLCASDALDLNKQLINELNVFPVPDGDTGTNMSLTMATAAAELRKKQPEPLTDVADNTASALLRGARGNSGVILSLLFRGISKGLKGKNTADALEFASAMSDGVDAAYKAVMKPAEGTILTVSRMATNSALEFAINGSDIELMFVCAIESAKDALKETVEQNPVLKRAGVIDAGGQGYVFMLEAMLASLQGRAVSARPAVLIPESSDRADFSSFQTEEITFAYCTEFIIDRENRSPVDLLRVSLENMGDSLVFVEDDEIIKVHVHTDDPGKALTKAIAYGSLASVKIENMRKQHTSQIVAGREAAAAPATETEEKKKKYGVVAVCAGEGMANLFSELGADRIVTGGQTMNPSTEDILKEVEGVPAETVFVLPNNKNIFMAAEQCSRLTEKKVIVIPTKNMPQGVSAMLNMDESAEEDELTETLKSAIDGVHTALVTYAARDSTFDENIIKANEYLVIYDGALLGSFKEQSSMWDAICGAFEALNPEVVSVYYGEDVDGESALSASGIFAEKFPDAEVSAIDGGQPVYYYMISAE